MGKSAGEKSVPSDARESMSQGEVIGILNEEATGG